MKYAIIFLATVVFIFFMLRSVDRTDLIPSYSGCFYSKVNGMEYDVSIKGDGKLDSGDVHATVTVSKDKGGLAFLPNKKIVISHAHGGSLLTEEGFPLLVRISNSGNSILIPSEDGSEAQLDRIPCK
jgi:hypothetical protein